jgi:hypothetical protein
MEISSFVLLVKEALKKKNVHPTFLPFTCLAIIYCMDAWLGKFDQYIRFLAGRCYQTMHVCLDTAQFPPIHEGIDFSLTEVHTHILRAPTEGGGWAGTYSRTDSSAIPQMHSKYLLVQ